MAAAFYYNDTMRTVSSSPAPATLHQRDFSGAEGDLLDGGDGDDGNSGCPACSMSSLRLSHCAVASSGSSFAVDSQTLQRGGNCGSSADSVDVAADREDNRN